MDSERALFNFFADAGETIVFGRRTQRVSPDKKQILNFFANLGDSILDLPRRILYRKLSSDNIEPKNSIVGVEGQRAHPVDFHEMVWEKFCKALAERERELISKARQEQADLTSREREILFALVQGYSNKEIARLLGISEQTVKHHIGNMLGKLGVTSRVELARFVSQASAQKSKLPS